MAQHTRRQTSSPRTTWQYFNRLLLRCGPLVNARRPVGKGGTRTGRCRRKKHLILLPHLSSTLKHCSDHILLSFLCHYRGYNFSTRRTYACTTSTSSNSRRLFLSSVLVAQRPHAHGLGRVPASRAIFSKSTARRLVGSRVWFIPPMEAPHSGQLERSIAPPHCSTR
jgi:hypothetical protein